MLTNIPIPQGIHCAMSTKGTKLTPGTQSTECKNTQNYKISTATPLSSFSLGQVNFVYIYYSKNIRFLVGFHIF